MPHELNVDSLLCKDRSSKEKSPSYNKTSNYADVKMNVSCKLKKTKKYCKHLNVLEWKH